jgi:sensor histidine kinase YesM
MAHVQDIPAKNKSDIRSFLLICLFASVPVYWASLFYIEVVTHHEKEELAAAATICFFGFFYIGWNLSRIWASHHKHISKKIFVLLSIIILASILWLFIHADFQLEEKPAINLLLFWLPFIIFSFTIGALVKLTRIYINTQIKQAYATAEQSQSELHLLQSQLSPHFLFNTLNNLYGLSITQHEKIPALLLKLSSLLRYSVYDVKDLFVPLKSEIDYISNYIDFEKIRIGDRLVLNSSFAPVTSEEIKIAPMLLITFIENAFKHSKNTVDKEIFVDIDLRIWNDRILFSVKNSYNRDENLQPGLKKDSGIGLVNAKKRLDLLYANEHELREEEKDGLYCVMLLLKVK